MTCLTDELLSYSVQGQMAAIISGFRDGRPGRRFLWGGDDTHAARGSSITPNLQPARISTCRTGLSSLVFMLLLILRLRLRTAMPNLPNLPIWTSRPMSCAVASPCRPVAHHSCSSRVASCEDQQRRATSPNMPVSAFFADRLASAVSAQSPRSVEPSVALALVPCLDLSSTVFNCLDRPWLALTCLSVARELQSSQSRYRSRSLQGEHTGFPRGGI